MRNEEGGIREEDGSRRMEDSRQDLRTECRGGGAVVGFGLPAALRLAQIGRTWPCISEEGGKIEE